MISKKKVIDFVLTTSIFYQVFITSSWQTVHPGHIWSFFGYTFYIFLFLFILVELFLQETSIKKMILCFFSLLLCVFYFYEQNIWCGVLFLYGTAATLVNADNLLDDYFDGIGTACVCVCLLAFLGYLPKYTEYGLLSFGFRNPNTTGFYLLVLFLIFLYKQQGKNKLGVFSVFVVVTVITLKYLEDYTVFGVLILSFLLYIFFNTGKRLSNFFPFRVILIILPVMLTVVTFWIGRNYLNFVWMEQLNSVFTQRPNIWNFYLTQFPPSLYPTHLSENINFFRGAFDGSFLYYPIVYGWLFFALILCVVCRAFSIVTEKKMYLLVIIMIVFLLAGFSENTPFIVTQSPFVPLCFNIIVMKETPILQKMSNGV